MPEMSGIELLEQLKKEGIDVPVIVQTADVQDWVKAHCLELSVKPFLNKPLQQDNLVEALGHILRSPANEEVSCTCPSFN